MSIDIVEMKSGFECNINGKKIKYIIGEALVELANFDFNNLRCLFDNFKERDNLTYENYFTNIFELYSLKNGTTSIHFELLKNTLRNFYDNYDDGSFDYNCKPFPYSTIPHQQQLKLNGEIKVFFSSLFSMQYKIRKILSCLALCENENKIKALSKLAKNKKKENEIQSLVDVDIFDFTPRITNHIYNEYDNLFYHPPLFTDNEINFTLHFSEVESFCFYELRRLLNSSVNIVCCPICNTFVASKDRRKKYCSNKCKGKSFEKNSTHSIYYELYRKRYKYLSNYYTEHNDIGGTIPEEVKYALKSLYDKYANKDENNKELVEKYKANLKNIK